MGEYTLLHFACSVGDLDIFEFVHEKCQDLKSVFDGDDDPGTLQNSTKENPLHFAVSRNNIEIAKVLIEDIRQIKEQSMEEDKSSNESQSMDLVDRDKSDQSNIFRGVLD